MKHILCFGDSNTYGCIPFGGRYDDNTRWTRLLANKLGEDYQIIEEGLNARTTSLDDPFEPYKNGMEQIIPCLHTHLPVDLTILMLGTNDLKDFFSPSAEKISSALHRMARIIMMVTQAPVLLVSPIHLGDEMADGPCFELFPPSSIEISKQLGASIKKVAEDLNIAFMDAADYAYPDPEDSVHLNPKGHAALAEAFYQKILEMNI